MQMTLTTCVQEDDWAQVQLVQPAKEDCDMAHLQQQHNGLGCGTPCRHDGTANLPQPVLGLVCHCDTTHSEADGDPLEDKQTV